MALANLTVNKCLIIARWMVVGKDSEAILSRSIDSQEAASSSSSSSKDSEEEEKEDEEVDVEGDEDVAREEKEVWEEESDPKGAHTPFLFARYFSFFGYLNNHTNDLLFFACRDVAI